MSMLGRKPARAPLSGADIPDSSITTAKIVDGTVAEGDLAFSTATQAELDAQRTNSSITTLGTVTAGNLSNANIVYPAGHVVKVTQHLDSTNYTTTGMTLKKGPTSGTITMNDTSNKMYISVMFLTQFTTNGMRVALYRNPTVSSGDLINGGVNLTPGTEPQTYITSGGSS